MKPTPYLVAEGVHVQRGTRVILDDVSVGIHPGDRVGIVGRNGSGKTTLLRILAGEVEPDSGRVTRTGATTTAVVSQIDAMPGRTARDALVGDAPDHEWASSARIRGIMTGLLGDVSAGFFREGLATPLEGMSGGELRRLTLAAALIREPDVLLLDEPTNHLDIEAVHWLGDYLRSWPRGRRALVLVTHDRWLLDTVTSETWEVVAGAVETYDGGYAAYVLAKAERDQMAAGVAAKRRNLLRKELAWLRRGAPARTSKPKFRIEAAESLIADEPAPRDSLVLHRVATARLGKTVIDLESVSLRPGTDAPEVLHRQTFRLGPGDRVGLLGPNGAGKTTLVRLLLGGDDAPPVEGFVRRGKTVVPAVLGQRLAELDPDDRVLPWLQRGGEHVVVTSGAELTASQLLEMFGFTGDAPHKRLGDLSGGERRRLELLRILLAGPNLLMLDEPTNDLDIETLTVLEDVLDTWPGSLLVISHDRYFLERVTDDIWAMLGDGRLRHLPGGVPEYLEARRELSQAPAASRSDRAHSRVAGARGTGSAGRAGGAVNAGSMGSAGGAAVAGVARGGAEGTHATAGAAGATGGATRPSAAEARRLHKAITRIERQLQKLSQRRDDLHLSLAEAATDPERLLTLTTELKTLETEQAELEEQWLAAGEALEL